MLGRTYGHHKLMSFFEAFARTLVWRPWLALEALWWHIIGKKLRARNRLRIAAAKAPHAYAMWIATVEATIPPPLANADFNPMRPLISVILHCPSGGDEQKLYTSLQSLKVQSYANWELVLIACTKDLAANHTLHQTSVTCLTLETASTEYCVEALSLGIQSARGSFVLPMVLGATLPNSALGRYADAIAAHPEARLIYSDQDSIDFRHQRSHPWFKPEWNADMFLSQDYISQSCLILTKAALAELPVETTRRKNSAYSLLLKVTGAGIRDISADDIAHIPHFLAHIPHFSADTMAEKHLENVEAVNQHLLLLGAKAEQGPFGTVRVKWPLPAPCELPLVSIIVPTRDHMKLLSTCIDGIINSTNYQKIEVIIIDNGSVERKALSYLSKLTLDSRIRVIRDDGNFNFSRLNNSAVNVANGDFICLLNNDIEILDADWLESLIRQAIRPNIAAVGAMLLYGDKCIQHAGVVIGIGQAAGHAHRFQKSDNEGYFAQAHIARQVSAVTAACLVVEKSKFEAVGGLDERSFAVAFNDVDLCLKLNKAGWRNIYEPAAVLIHHESKSRARDHRPEQIGRYMSELSTLQSRWGTILHIDPTFHCALDSASETYILKL